MSHYLYYFFGCNATQNGSAFVGNFAARILKGTGLYTGSYTVPTSPFTDITNTVTLLNGAGGALFDQTGKTNLITVGNAQLSTSFKKFGTASAKFDHTGDYLKISRSSFIPIGLGDFTIECFAYFAATPVGDGQGTKSSVDGLRFVTRAVARSSEIYVTVIITVRTEITQGIIICRCTT